MLSEKEKRHLIDMVRKYLDGKASPAEAAFVEQYYRYFDVATAETASSVNPDEATFDATTGNQPAATPIAGEGWPAIEERMFRQLMARVDADEPIREIVGQRKMPVYRMSFLRIAAVAAVLLTIGGVWWSGRRGQQPAVTTTATYKNDILPGGDKATLTLSNGEVIDLDSAANGHLAVQGQSSVVKLSNGQLVYEQLGAKAAAPLYNTLATPIGGQYRLTLPDGSKVWLNSESSIRYPAVFAGRQRSVEIAGQAYFEIKADPRAPFVVHAEGTTVQVLGTHFDVMAYDDEASVNTTLVEGKVRVAAGRDGVVLKAGEQAVIEKGSAAIAVRAVDTDRETAWTTGFFEFDQTDLHTLMRQLRRWYGIEPVYQSEGSGRTFGGRIKRDLKLSEVLSLLEGNGIHFRLEGKKLIVLP